MAKAYLIGTSGGTPPEAEAGTGDNRNMNETDAPSAADGLAGEFLSASTRRLRQFTDRIEVCAAMLTGEQIWVRTGGNAIGNLMLHLAGNLRQWILSGVGGKPDTRIREAEFAATGGVSREELFTRLRDVVEEACEVIDALPAGRLLERRRIQNYEISVLEAVYHAVEHYAQHSAQIFLITKILTQKDLAFYGHLKDPAHEARTP